MYSTIQSMKCYDAKNNLRAALQTFQKGVLLSIKSLKTLLSDSTAIGISFILTHRLNQDCLENFFSQVRGKTRFKEHPNTVECLYNIRSIILGRNPTITKQLHTNTIDKLPDEYVTSEFCKQASKDTKVSSTSALTDSLADETEAVDDVDPLMECDVDLDHFEESTSMSTDDGIGKFSKSSSYVNCESIFLSL